MHIEKFDVIAHTMHDLWTGLMGNTCIESLAGVEVNFGGNCSKDGEMLGVLELLLLQLATRAGLLAR